jgi:hypothetical protein
MMTGEPYKVICNGVSKNTSDWLYAELDKLRIAEKPAGR